MFYCDVCAEEYDYPKSIGKSIGNCEFCGEHCVCNDIPASQLPEPKTDYEENN